MDAGDDQNTGPTNGNAPSAGNSRPPQIAHMSLYERQAVQVIILLLFLSLLHESLSLTIGRMSALNVELLALPRNDQSRRACAYWRVAGIKS